MPDTAPASSRRLNPVYALLARLNTAPGDLPRLLLLLLGLGLMFALSMGTHPFIPSMEPRFGEVIREMYQTGEYLIPIKNGVAYIMYPPLYYWLGLAGKFAGLPDTVAIRLPAALAFLLFIVWLWRLQRVLRPEWPPLLLALTGAALPGVLYHYFIAQSDSLLVLGALIAFTGYVRWRRGAVQGFPWELWLGVTLATCAKGPVGIAVTLPAMGLELAWAATQQGGGWWHALWRSAWRMGWLRGLGLILLANAPWYVAAGLREGWEFCRAILVYQNFTRFLVGFDHIQPWWYYGKTIWYDLFPLSLLFPVGLYAGWRRRKEFDYRLLLVWSLYTLLFFSFSASKQGKYIFTAAPAIALLGLTALDTLFSATWRARLRRYLSYWAIGLLAAFAVAAVFVLPHYGERVGGAAGLDRVRDIVNAAPGRVISYDWPRAMMLYELGAPMPYVRSSRELYAQIAAGKIRPGDYILVNEKYLPRPGQAPGATTFYPGPLPPYFEKLLSIDFNGTVDLYRVLPAAATMPLPATPEPLPLHWWDHFDTD